MALQPHAAQVAFFAAFDHADDGGGGLYGGLAPPPPKKAKAGGAIKPAMAMPLQLRKADGGGGGARAWSKGGAVLAGRSLGGTAVLAAPWLGHHQLL